uniref:G-protein coupled receptors family 1 profile domain-containing protein n=1 Tax=Magallana gigas TaxID=29159 RepID=A0A8W8LGD8_MAGGI
MSETLKDTHCSIRCIQCTLRRRVSEISDITETRSLRLAYNGKGTFIGKVPPSDMAGPDDFQIMEVVTEASTGLKRANLRAPYTKARPEMTKKRQLTILPVRTWGEYRYWILALILFPLLTVFGNVLVVMSVYRERSLRTVTNYFICSLAVADIRVAVMVMPLAIYLEKFYCEEENVLRV